VIARDPLRLAAARLAADHVLRAEAWAGDVDAELVVALGQLHQRILGHRFSSVRAADRIYVLKHGKVVEHGSHSQLMAEGGLYAELFTLQASAYLNASEA
jgi:ATP-binding cassette subfamily B protein